MVDLKIESGIAVVTIGHGKANALDFELCEGLAKCFDELGRSDVRAVVVTGRGRMFSAGVDLLRLSAGGASYVREFLPALHKLYYAVFFHPKAVVAAINGHAIAGGCVLACCADRRIMARGEGRIGVTELRVGVPFPALPMEILRFAVQGRHLPEVIFGGGTDDADTALRRGWVDEVVDADALMERAKEAAAQLAELSPAAFALTKRQLRQPVIDQLESCGASIEQAAVDIWAADDTLGNVRAYVARTLKKG